LIQDIFSIAYENMSVITGSQQINYSKPLDIRHKENIPDKEV